jgi:hypothetical protein
LIMRSDPQTPQRQNAEAEESDDTVENLIRHE